MPPRIALRLAVAARSHGGKRAPGERALEAAAIPIWRHGGIAHGPTPRSYSFHLPKKMVLGALRSALTDKFNGNAITVVDEFALQNHKSKDLRKRLNGIELNKKLLIVETGENTNLDRASGNLDKVKLVSSRELNVYDLLNHEQVLFSKAAIQKLQEALSV